MLRYSIRFRVGLTIIYLDYHHRYRALKMSPGISRREREAGEMAAKCDIAATQSYTASLMSVILPKKVCVGGGGGGGVKIWRWDFR